MIKINKEIEKNLKKKRYYKEYNKKYYQDKKKRILLKNKIYIFKGKIKHNIFNIIDNILDESDLRYINNEGFNKEDIEYIKSLNN